MDLFSYAEAWSCQKKGVQLYHHLRYSYLFKALILLPFLPFDIVYLVALRFFWGKATPGYVFNSSKALNQCLDVVKNKSIKLFLMSDPITLIRHNNRLIQYIPASPIYIMCAFLPWKGRHRELSNKLIVSFTGYLLKQLFLPGRFIFVMHSDALPFARSVLFATRDDSEISSISACIQHGIFHEHFECTELDGSLAKINVVRSEFDKGLIERNNKNSIFIVSEDFFLPPVSKRIAEHCAPVILVGEGFHVVDKLLSEKYISRLKLIEAELLNQGWIVKYRPHPSERFIYRSFGFKDIDNSELTDSLALALTYIGYSSTLLIEASSVGIPCYAVKIDDEAQVNLQRNFGASEILDYKISEFFPQANPSERGLHSNTRRLAAQKAVFSMIDEIYYG